MSPEDEAAAFWGSAENPVWTVEQRLACALKALKFFGTAYEEAAAEGVFAWDNLGVDDGGLPRHLPFSHTVNCEGPTEPDDPDHLACWCGKPCPLHLALRDAHRAGMRRFGPRDVREYRRCDTVSRVT